MSLYNMIFGTNPAAGILLQSLSLNNEAPENFHDDLEKFSDGWGDYDLSSNDAKALMQKAVDAKYYPVGRFRDIYFNNEDPKNPKIVLYTRNGGGNRSAYEYVFDLLSKHPNYIQDYDDDFDSTYAYIEFKAPQQVLDFFEGLQTGKLESVSDKFKKEIAEMEAGKEPNKELKNFMEGLIKIIDENGK